MARPWAPEIPEADFKEAIRRPGHVKELLQLRLDQRNRTNRPTRPFVGYMNEAELLITQSKPHTLNALTIASAGSVRTARSECPCVSLRNHFRDAIESGGLLEFLRSSKTRVGPKSQAIRIC
jgi:hypothetical protein